MLKLGTLGLQAGEHVRIRAIRLAEVGPFSAGVVLEGLSGGLDVLAGPNELGKSTIFEALKLALFEKFTAKNKRIEALRSHDRGAPVVEVDFEVGGESWRLFKRFLSGRAAELEATATGKRYSGADAENHLSHLLSGTPHQGSRFALLWVGQGAPLLQPQPDPDQRLLLATLIGREVEAVADGGLARAVRERVKLDLAPLAGGRAGAPKIGSEFDTALRLRERLRRETEQAREAARSAAADLDELTQLRSKRHEADSSAERVRLHRLAEEAQRTLEEARRLNDQLAIADAKAKAAELALEKARDGLGQFDTLAAELARLEGDNSIGQSTFAEVMLALDEADAVLAAAQSAIEHDEAELQRLRDLVIARERADAATATRKRAAEIEHAIREAKVLIKAIEQGERALAANRATAERMHLLEVKEQSILLLESKLAAAAPRVQITYATGVAGRIRVGGMALANGAELNVRSPIVFEIDGIGTMTVAPAASERTHCERDIAGLGAEVAELLSAIGARDAADARDMQSRRQELVSSLDRQRAALAALAPQGLPELELKSKLANDAVRDYLIAAEDALPLSCETEHSIAVTSNGLAASRAAAQAARQRRDSVREQLAGLKAEIAGREARKAELAKSLPPAAERPAARAELSEQFAKAAAAANAAVRAHIALAEKAVPDDVLGAFAVQYRAAADALKQFDGERQAMEIRIAELEARLGEVAEISNATRVAELEGELERAEAQVARFDAAKAALELLGQALDEAEKGTRARFLEPVLTRIAPYLDYVMPEARVAFGENFNIAALERNGLAVTLHTLSGGTQEQISLLVRLGFGKLLADTGMSAPLILDDALVYSDDARIVSMFRALEMAAKAHQVIVLTCRTTTFAQLGGKRLAIAPWQRH
jgi:chromosome segregation ATPase